MEQISLDEIKKENKINLLKLNDIKEEYREIYNALNEPLSINEISDKTGILLTEVYSKLFMMELEGIVIQTQNKYKIV